VAGGMVTAKRSDLGGIHREGERVLLSLPADLAEELMASEAFAARRDDVDIRRISGQRSNEIFETLE